MKALLLALAVLAACGGSTPATTAPVENTSAPRPPPPVPAPPRIEGDVNTGFDLYTTPSGIATWKLDGEERTERLPSRIRGVRPGKHTVEIVAPPGFVGTTQEIDVEAGTSQVVMIDLQAAPSP